MRCDHRLTIVITMLLLAVAVPALPAKAPVPQTENRLVQLSDVQAAEYLERVLGRESTAEDWDDVTRLAAARPQLIVPRLLRQIETGRKNGMRPEEIERLAHVVAFAGEDKAVEGLASLALADGDRYTRFLVEALSYAFDRGRGFSMAFLAAKRSEAIDHAIGSWIGAHVGQDRDAAALLAAIVVWRGGDDLEHTLSTEPLLSQMPPTAHERLTAALASREQRQ